MYIWHVQWDRSQSVHAAQTDPNPVPAPARRTQTPQPPTRGRTAASACWRPIVFVSRTQRSGSSSRPGGQGKNAGRSDRSLWDRRTGAQTRNRPFRAASSGARDFRVCSHTDESRADPRRDAARARRRRRVAQTPAAILSPPMIARSVSDRTASLQLRPSRTTMPAASRRIQGRPHPVSADGAELPPRFQPIDVEVTVGPGPPDPDPAPAAKPRPSHNTCWRSRGSDRNWTPADRKMLWWPPASSSQQPERVLTGVEARRFAPPQLPGPDGLDAASAHARPSWLLRTMPIHTPPTCCGRRPVHDDALFGDR